jgi:hypothetical protein
MPVRQQSGGHTLGVVKPPRQLKAAAAGHQQ